MKIQCSCNQLIIDQKDNLNYKGYIISDVDWNKFWDSIDEKIKPTVPTETIDSESVQLELQQLFKTAWECINCGELYIQVGYGQLSQYSSYNGKYNRVLDNNV